MASSDFENDNVGRIKLVLKGGSDSGERTGIMCVTVSSANRTRLSTVDMWGDMLRVVNCVSGRGPACFSTKIMMSRREAFVVLSSTRYIYLKEST